jgi:hypothetical protein
MKLDFSESGERDKIVYEDEGSHHVIENENVANIGWTSPLMDTPREFSNFKDQLANAEVKDRNRRKERFRLQM